MYALRVACLTATCHCLHPLSVHWYEADAIQEAHKAGALTPRPACSPSERVGDLIPALQRLRGKGTAARVPIM